MSFKENKKMSGPIEGLYRLILQYNFKVESCEPCGGGAYKIILTNKEGVDRIVRLYPQGNFKRAR